MELRIPPLLLALLMGVAAYGLHAISSGLTRGFPGRVWLAPALFGAGIAVAVAGVVEFRRARTTAWAAFLANPVTLIGPIAFVAYMNRFQIRPEERILAAGFGPSYESYLARVRRWI